MKRNPYEPPATGLGRRLQLEEVVPKWRLVVAALALGQLILAALALPVILVLVNEGANSVAWGAMLLLASFLEALGGLLLALRLRVSRYAFLFAFLCSLVPLYSWTGGLDPMLLHYQYLPMLLLPPLALASVVAAFMLFRAKAGFGASARAGT